MLTKTVKTTKQVPVKVIRFKWGGIVSKKLRTLPCTACRGSVGDQKEFGMAWIVDEKGKRPMRLCNECGKKAEQDIRDSS